MTFEDSVKEIVIKKIDAASKEVRLLEDLCRDASIDISTSNLCIVAKSKESVLKNLLKEIMSIG